MTAAASSKLRILFITEDDPLYVIRFFEVFFEEYPRNEIDVCGVTVDHAFHEPIWKTALRLWHFYGPVDFARLGGRFAFVKLRGVSIERLAKQYGITSMPTSSVNEPAYVERVKELAPDVIVSVAAPEIFKKCILVAARNRCVNIHSGRLPKYRGMLPNFWQLLEGERVATVTVHEMVEKIDAGTVLGTIEVPLREQDRLDRVITETKCQGARLMIDLLRKIAAGADEPIPLGQEEANYYSWPKNQDVRKFRARGHRLL